MTEKNKNAIVPLAEIKDMAQAVATSGLFGVKNKEQAVALMLVAQSEGLHPAVAARDYDIIQGRPSKKSEAMQRSFMESGGTIEWIELSDTIAKAKFSHPQGGSVTIDWTIQRAQKAGLAKNHMYSKYPRNMLRARCVSEGVRTVCPLATGGMYTPEEAQDMPKEPINVTPKQQPEGQKPDPVAAAITEIESSGDMNTLRAVFETHYKLMANDQQAIVAITDAKEKRKAEIEGRAKPTKAASAVMAKKQPEPVTVEGTAEEVADDDAPF